MDYRRERVTIETEPSKIVSAPPEPRRPGSAAAVLHKLYCSRA